MTDPFDLTNRRPAILSETLLAETAADVEMLVSALEARLDDGDHVLVHRLRLAAQTLGVASVASAVRRNLRG
jgi:hypothetical protein